MQSTRVYRDDAFRERVEFASSVIARGRSTTRNFDTCFEMSDGDSVVASLVRRAKAKPTGRLAQNLYRYIVQAGAEAAYDATKHLSDADLVKHATEERERARNTFAELMEKREADKAK